MKGGILNSLLKPFINAINATQPACHGDIIPRNLFSTTSTHERVHVENSRQNAATEATTAFPETQTIFEEARTNDTAAPLDINMESTETYAEMNSAEEGKPADQQQLREINPPSFSNNNLPSSSSNEKSVAKDNKEEIASPGPSKKRRARRKTEVSGEDVFKNWDKPLLQRLRPNRAAGYNKNDRAIERPRFQLVKMNGRSHFEKVQEEPRRVTAIAKKCKPR